MQFYFTFTNVAQEQKKVANLNGHGELYSQP